VTSHAEIGRSRVPTAAATVAPVLALGNYVHDDPLGAGGATALRLRFAARRADQGDREQSGSYQDRLEAPLAEAARLPVSAAGVCRRPAVDYCRPLVCAKHQRACDKTSYVIEVVTCVTHLSY